MEYFCALYMSMVIDLLHKVSFQIRTKLPWSSGFALLHSLLFTGSKFSVARKVFLKIAAVVLPVKLV